MEPWLGQGPGHASQLCQRPGRTRDRLLRVTIRSLAAQRLAARCMPTQCQRSRHPALQDPQDTCLTRSGRPGS